MITITNVKTLSGQIKNHQIESVVKQEIDAQGKWTLFPALIDPHVHFRTPGHEYKEDWKSGAEAAIRGGVTTVFDMPNNTPPIVDLKTLEAKKKIIDSMLQDVGIPLRYKLYLGADKTHLEDIALCADKIVGIKVYMGCSTGNMLMDDDDSLRRLFQVAAQCNLVVAVHAEDEKIMKVNKQKYEGRTDSAVHSLIRSHEAAAVAAERAIRFAEEFNAELYLAHISTKQEVELIREAKKRQLLVYGEVSPHHLFLTESAYESLANFVQVNPPLREQVDVDALWAGIADGTIDTIGTDHAPHTIEEKKKPYGQSPSGVPGIETMLPLLLDAASRGLLSLEKIVELTRVNAENIFRIPRNDDVVLVDLEMKKKVDEKNLKTKCGWSPFAGRELKGWPVVTIAQGKVFRL